MDQKTGTVICDNCGAKIIYSANKDMEKHICPLCGKEIKLSG
jgi:DNA-directed RNA polymerase subunit RPC12/RpoP